MSMNECYERFKMGAFMGATVGASMGILFGAYTVYRFGHGGEGTARVLGKAALESGGLFGLLMGIGGLIRCDDDYPKLLDVTPSSPCHHHHHLTKGESLFSMHRRQEEPLP